MTGEKPRILVVDDETAQMQALCATLPDHGYAPIGFTNGEAALEELRRAKCDLLLADLTMPGMDGITLLQAARKIDPDLVAVIMTGAVRRLRLENADLRRRSGAAEAGRRQSAFQRVQIYRYQEKSHCRGFRLGRGEREDLFRSGQRDRI